MMNKNIFLRYKNLIKIFLILIFLIFIIFSGIKSKKKHIKSDFNSKVALIYTSNIQGFLSPCGCHKNSLGGMSKLISLIKEINFIFKGKILFIDNGNLIINRDILFQLKNIFFFKKYAGLMVKILSTVNLNGILLGTVDRENKNIYSLFKILKQYKIVLVNIQNKIHYNKKNNFIINKSFIFKMKNIAIGILGLNIKISNNIINTKKKLNKEIFYLYKKGVSFIVIMTQINSNEVYKIIDKIPGIDFIILGKEYDLKDARSYKIKNVVYMSIPSYGQYLGVIEFYLNKLKTMFFFKNDKNILNKLLKKNIFYIKERLRNNQNNKPLLCKKIWTIINKYKVKNEKSDNIKKNIITRAIPINKNIIADNESELIIKSLNSNKYFHELKILNNYIYIDQLHYIGNIYCISCHNNFYLYQNTLLNSLKNKKYHFNAFTCIKDNNIKCIKCHSTGWLYPGGFKNINHKNQYINVQCEACHGPGSIHKYTMSSNDIKKKINESKCRICHQLPHIKKLIDFKYMKRILRVILVEHMKVYFN